MNLILPNTIYAVIGLYFTIVHEIEGLKIMSMMNGYTSQILESKLSVFLITINLKNAAEIMMKRTQLAIKFSGQISLKFISNSHYIGDTLNKISNCLNSCLRDI